MCRGHAHMYHWVLTYQEQRYAQAYCSYLYSQHMLRSWKTSLVANRCFSTVHIVINILLTFVVVSQLIRQVYLFRLLFLGRLSVQVGSQHRRHPGYDMFTSRLPKNKSDHAFTSWAKRYLKLDSSQLGKQKLTSYFKRNCSEPDPVTALQVSSRNTR